MVLAAVAAVLAAGAGSASAAPAGSAPPRVRLAATTGALPAGWSLTATGAGVRLVWTSGAPLPVADARVVVRADGRVLGPATTSADGRRVSIDVAAGVVRDLGSLQVEAAGRRLDAAPAPAARRPAATAPSTSAPAAAPLPASLDPGRPGPYRTRQGEYTLPGLAVTGLPVPVEMQAVIVAPVGAKGSRPLALFLHGRHYTCYGPVRPGAEPDITGDWPCAAGFRPVPSHLGYLQMQRLLASQGWLTVSISANGINGQDFALIDGGAAARSQLIRAHLQRWADWSRSAAAWAKAPTAVRAGPRPQLDTVLLVGHSRGGEGANRAALDSTRPQQLPGRQPAKVAWRIAGQVLIAPTAFGQNPAPGVPTEVLLPYCDGDVFDLQGQEFLDAARSYGPDPSLRSAVMVLGANHNYFNSEWTPGESAAPSFDDWFEPTDPACGTPHRLTPLQQRTVGATYIAAAARVFGYRDTKVEPLLDGSPVRAASVGSARVLTHALGARRTPLVLPGQGSNVTATAPVTASLCDTDGFDPYSGPTPTACSAGLESGVTPHFLPLFAGEPSRKAVRAIWSGVTGSTGSVRIPLARPGSLAGADALALRVIVPPDGATTRFAVRVADPAGHRAVLGVATLTGLPASSMVGKYWAQEVRLPLTAARAAGLDLRRISEVTLLPRSASGKLWLLDGWGRRAGLGDDDPFRLPRIDAGAVTVAEGNAGTRTVNVPVVVSGRVGRGAAVWIGVADYSPGGAVSGRVVALRPGQRTVTVPVVVSGNTIDDEDYPVQVQVEAVRGVSVGDYVGGLTVLDDDPDPVMSVTPLVSVAKGQPLRWRVSLSAPTTRFVYAFGPLVDPATIAGGAPGGALPELTTADVPADWVRAVTGTDPPNPPIALSAAAIYLFVEFPPGAGSADLEIPTLAGTAAGSRQVAISLPKEYNPLLAADTVIGGVVSD